MRDAVVVTQGFHMPRALFLADAAGIDATGLTADLHRWGYQGEKSEVREVLSRVKAIADVTLDTPAMAGPAIPIAHHRRPRKLGPGTAAGHAARRLARPLSRVRLCPYAYKATQGSLLAAVRQGVGVEAQVGGPVGVPVAAVVAARP